MIDIVDKKILLTLLKEGRVSQREISKEVGMSATTTYYRLNKLLEEKIIKSFSLYINPNFYYKYFGMVGFKTTKDIDADFLNVKIESLDGGGFYEFEGSSVEELTEKLSYMSSVLGELEMTYIPEQIPLKPSGVDIEIIKVLIKDPRMKPGQISRILGIPPKSIKHRVRTLADRKYIKIVPIIDLGKTDIVVFGVYSNEISRLEFLQRCEFLSFTNHDRGIILCAVYDLKEAETYIKGVKQIDPSSYTTIITDYEIRNENAKKELERIEKAALKNT